MCTHVVVLLRVGEQLYACNSSIQTSAGVAAVATLVGGAAGGGGVVVLVAAAAAQAAVVFISGSGDRDQHPHSTVGPAGSTT